MNDDLISRQAAIDALGEEPYVWTEDDEFAQGTRYQWKNDHDAIEALPTVKAVPVEYIKNQIGRWERSKCQSYHAICYRHLIEEWEMENERKE